MIAPRMPLLTSPLQKTTRVAQGSPITNIERKSEWNQTYHKSSYDWGEYVEQTIDGGYILTGITGPIADDRDVWLIKTDTTGHVLWDQTYGGPSDDEGYCGKQTVDGGYILTGTTFSYGAGMRDAWLIKTDATGHVLWNQTYGGPYYDAGLWGEQTADGSHIITGFTDSYGSGARDIWLIKVSETETVTSPAVIEAPWGMVFLALAVLGIIFVGRVVFAKRKR